ncbi:MAG TPA: glycosyltransferase [Candidatus Paceibacterota bacterium]|nr:glycosyltransferase [Verrucomicrobiota bacterium]HSA12404.1 glycosyltransferase [Candidatus Paceibacterota bacterium]
MSSHSALVSILVPAYNAARYLPQLCESIQAQTYPHYEVLIGNDGSTDDTAAVAAPFLRDTRFRLLQWQPNRGLNVAWGLLLSAMKGEYWCCPGADDVLHPSFLERRVEVMESNRQACLVHGPPELIDESGNPPQRGPGLLDLPTQLCPPRSLEVLLEHNVINQPSTLVRASVTRQVLSFYRWEWAYSPDWFLWVLHAATGLDLIWDPQILIKYRVHSSSLSCAPEKDFVRRAEVRLVPVVALRTAAQFSQWAAKSWSWWGRTLYRRWLRQAAALKWKGGLRDEWLQLAAHAYYGARGRRASLGIELARHAVGLLAADFRHRRAQGRQRFIVSGLAQIEDPIFR